MAKQPERTMIGSEKLGEDFYLARCRVSFTDEQLAHMNREASGLTVDIGTLEEEKKASASDFTARLKRMRTTRDNLAEKSSRGYEVQEIECVVEVPARRNVKVFKCRRTGDKIGEEALAPGERVQPELTTVGKAVKEFKDANTRDEVDRASGNIVEAVFGDDDPAPKRRRASKKKKAAKRKKKTAKRSTKKGGN